MSGISNYFTRRDIRKQASLAIRHAHHIRNMRGDILSAAELQRLERAMTAIADALAARDWKATETATASLCDVLGNVAPEPSHPGLRENVEVIVVAIAVAMAFRTYFLQPFKIPTGSMEPTLHGINSVPVQAPTLTDRMPIKLVKWLATGEWYSEVVIHRAGELSGPEASQDDPSVVHFFCGGIRYRVPRDARINARLGEFLPKGHVLCSVRVKAGDHVFVDKVSWNFRAPRRGDVMVFNTEGITALPQGTHYIKRMVGLPNETISVDPPFLKINGDAVMAPESIARISRKDPGYDGYKVVGMLSPEGLLRSSSDSHRLGPTEYFAMGDNTGNSRDSRYWGTVPQVNLVGPGVFVYWPFGANWGVIQ